MNRPSDQDDDDVVLEPSPIPPPAVPGAPAATAVPDALASPAAPAEGPSPEQLAAIEAARKQFGRVRRAAGVAKISGWSLAIFAALTILTGFSHLDALALGVALGAVAYAELMGARGLRNINDRAPFHLAINQATLTVILVFWCIYRITGVMTGPGALATQIDPNSPVLASVQSIDDLTATLTAAIYGVMLVCVLFVQTCMILYYATRRAAVRRLQHETPQWVLNLLCTAAGR